MNHELAKVLTTALVQFIDREQPKDKMCVSSAEAEEIERRFTEDKFEQIEDWCTYRMLPEEKPSKNLKEIAGEWAENEAYGKSDTEFEMAYKGFKAGAKWAMHQLKEWEK